MADERIVYGIHSITPLRKSDNMPFGILKVIGGGTLELTAETEKLFGGSQKFPWATESKTIDATWNATVKAMPNFLFELFLGAAVKNYEASETGTVDALENAKGTSVKGDAGIASVQLTSQATAKLHTGTYIIKAVSANTIDIYATTDIDFGKGENKLKFVDESLKVTAAPLTLTQSSTVAVDDLGIEFVCGGTETALKEGDTATFRIVAPHGGFSEILLGSESTTFPVHRQICLAQKRSNGDIFELDLFSVVGSGMPIGMTEQSFSEAELTMSLEYDPERDGIGKITAIKGQR